MKTNLEDFIHKNKEAFDEHEPSAALWHRLDKQMKAAGGAKPQGKMVRLTSLKWAVAAALVIIAATFVFNYTKKEDLRDLPIAINNDTNSYIPNQNTDVAGDHVSSPSLHDTSSIINPVINQPAGGNTGKAARPKMNETFLQSNDTNSEELYHYTKLIEIKQQQMAALKENEPELYNQFSKDHEALERSYQLLREKQKQGLNSEQLLEAMVQNLKMQSNLLNKQLDIIRRVKNKKERNEKDYIDI